MLLAYSMEYRLIPETWYEVRKKDWIMPWEGNHILVELPIREPEKTGSIEPVTEIRQLIAEGYQPVLAHPERYLYLSTEKYICRSTVSTESGVRRRVLWEDCKRKGCRIECRWHV